MVWSVMQPAIIYAHYTIEATKIRGHERPFRNSHIRAGQLFIIVRYPVCEKQKWPTAYISMPVPEVMKQP